jgi:hypothetical protein
LLFQDFLKTDQTFQFGVDGFNTHLRTNTVLLPCYRMRFSTGILLLPDLTLIFPSGIQFGICWVWVCVLELGLYSFYGFSGKKVNEYLNIL